MIFGYRSEDPQLAAMMNGGGFLSMVQVSVIVGISSAYAGIFEGTGLLLGIKRYVEAVSREDHALRRDPGSLCGHLHDLL